MFNLGSAEVCIPDVKTTILSAEAIIGADMPDEGDVTIRFKPGTSDLARQGRITQSD